MTEGRKGRPIEILLIEDNPDDVRLTREALKEANVRNTIHVVSDGIKALAFLQHQGKYAQVPTPDLILLDLNLPKKDGRQVLAEIKDIPGLASIPVAVMTTSQDEEDVLRAQNLNAHCYITKPIDYDQFINMVRSLKSFWLTIVEPPLD